MRYPMYTERRDAVRASKAALKAMRPRTYEDGKGCPPGKQHGAGPRLPAGMGYTTQAETVHTGRVADQYFVLAHDELPDKDVDIDGVMTRPPRGGEELTREDFDAEPTIELEPAPARTR